MQQQSGNEGVKNLSEAYLLGENFKGLYRVTHRKIESFLCFLSNCVCVPAWRRVHVCVHRTPGMHEGRSD